MHGNKFCTTYLLAGLSRLDLRVESGQRGLKAGCGSERGGGPCPGLQYGGQGGGEIEQGGEGGAGCQAIQQGTAVLLQFPGQHDLPATHSLLLKLSAWTARSARANLAAGRQQTSHRPAPPLGVGQGETRTERDAAPVLLCPAVAEEAAMFAVGDVMVAVTNPGTDGAAAHPVHHTAGVAVVPVLVHELLLREREGAQAVPGRLVVAVVG